MLNHYFYSSKIIDRYNEKIAVSKDKLNRYKPEFILETKRKEHQDLSLRLDTAMNKYLQKQDDQLMRLLRNLNNLGPKQVLRRGYSILINKETNKVIKDHTILKSGDKVQAKLDSGELDLSVD